MRAQIKMGETIAILIVFFFLMVFGFSFYVRIQQTTFGRQGREQVDLRTIQIAQKASFLPELQCSFRNVQVDNCVDIIKLEIFSRLLSDTEGEFYSYYYSIFGYSDVHIEKIYPPGRTYNLYSKVPPDKLQYNLSTKVPISLYNATSKLYSFGLLYVNVYG
jgi:hypothetical protein